MDYIKSLFNKNFLEYASYVIRDRAIPDLEDGLKPVQRRILHSLFEMDDGKFHKVANVVGHCMKYHPRITSYNVCYTKLLRNPLKSPRRRPRWCVITSYSIHYTKLYDECR